MSWKEASLGEVAEIVSGATPKSSVSEYWGGDVAWATPTDLSRLQRKHLEKTERTITKAGLASCSAKVLPANSVLFSSRAPIGLVAVNTIPVATNQGFKSFVTGEALDSNFLYWWLKANRQRIEDLGTGATFKEISKRVVSEVKVPLPPIADQRRIAAILDKADAIRSKREETLSLADEFLKSLFLGMFGDPVKNPMGWDWCELGSACSKITDGTHDTPPRQSNGIMFITGKNIRPFRINTENIEYVSEEVHREIFRRCNPEFGDVLFTNIGANTGTAAFNEFDFEFSMKNVALLKPSRDILTGRYLEYVLNHEGFKSKTLKKLGLGGAQGFLGLRSIKSIKIPVPPIAKQVEFQNYFQAAQAVLDNLKTSLLESENLCASLSVSAFRDEL